MSNHAWIVTFFISTIVKSPIVLMVMVQVATYILHCVCLSQSNPRWICSPTLTNTITFSGTPYTPILRSTSSYILPFIMVTLMRGAFNSLTFSMEIRLQSIIVRLQPKSTMHGLLTSFSIQFVTQGFIYWPPWLPTTYCELVKGFYLYILAPDKAVDTMCSNNHWSKPKKKLN